MGLPWVFTVYSLVGLAVNGEVSTVPSVQAHGDDDGTCHYELKIPKYKCSDDVATDVNEIKNRLAIIEKQIEHLMASILPPDYEVSDYPLPSFSSVVEIDPSTLPMISTAGQSDQSSLSGSETVSPPGVQEASAVDKFSLETENQFRAEVLGGFVGSSPGTKSKLEAVPGYEQVATEIEISPIVKPLHDDASNLEAAPALESPAKDKDLERGTGDEDTPEMPPYERDTPQVEEKVDIPRDGVVSGRAAASSGLASTTVPEKLEKEQVTSSEETLIGGEADARSGTHKHRWRLHQDEATSTDNSERRTPHPEPLGRSGTICKDGCSCLRLWAYWQDGVYAVGNPAGSGKKGAQVMVYCDMTTDGGAWTVIQNRKDGSRNFYRDWSSYANGFGRLDSDFWLGNGMLHGLTSRLHYQLRVEFTDWDDQEGSAVYDSFMVGSEEQRHRLTLGRFLAGNRGDALSYHNNSYFSTYDRDYDATPRANCAQLRQAGFWFRACNRANPNGRYVRGPDAAGLNGGVITWGTWEGHGFNYALKSFRMMIRPVDYKNILYY